CAISTFVAWASRPGVGAAGRTPAPAAKLRERPAALLALRCHSFGKQAQELPLFRPVSNIRPSAFSIIGTSASCGATCRPVHGLILGPLIISIKALHRKAAKTTAVVA